MRELEMWCPAPLSEGELHRRKLRSDKYKPPAGRLLENYESNSSVEADKDTNAEAGADPAAGAMKSRCKTRSMVAKKSSSAVAAAISAVKAAEQKKKKRKRRAASPLAVTTPSIPTPRSCEVDSEEEEEEKKKDEPSQSCPSLKTRQRGGRKVMLPRGSGSWCRRCRRMPSDVGWRRSAVLRRRRQRYLQLLSLGCFGRRLGFRP
jgi:hypothetical protein